MHPQTVRRLFIFVLILLPVQYGLIGVIGHYYDAEPWPAIVLPGFKHVYSTDDAFEVDHTAVEVQFADGEQASVSSSAFLAPFPRSHHSAFLQVQCKPTALSERADTERCLEPEGQRWFTSRAADLFPERDVRQVDVVWSRLRFEPPTSTLIPQDTLRLTP